MQALRSPSDRLRVASKIWHAFMRTKGERFDLSVFLRDANYEKQWVDLALASGVSELIDAARAWQELKDKPAAPPGTGFTPDSAFPGSSFNGYESTLPPSSGNASPPATTPKSKYLRGVR